MDFKCELEEMRTKYTANPPKDFKIHRPWWMENNDGLAKLYIEKNILLKYGKVYWAHLVQANSILFKKMPPIDCPATIVYSTDIGIDKNPILLQKLAENIYFYKNSEQEPPKEWKKMVECIKDEEDRQPFSFNSTVDGYTFKTEMRALMIFRKHIPKRVLTDSIFPIIAAPGRCESVLILPSKYWGEKFKTAWRFGIVGYEE